MGSFERPRRNLPTVSVVLSFLNSRRTIAQCLSSLAEQNYPMELFDVVVVDGGSTDGSALVCEQMRLRFKNLRLMPMPGCTEPEGQIAGVESSGGEVVMFTNSDIYVPSDWISRHVRWLMSGFDLVGGRVFWGGDKYAFTWNVPIPDRPQYEQQPGMGLGFSNCSVRRRDFTEVGGIAKLQSQHDTEFALRMVKRGRRLILDPKIEVYHDHPLKSLGGSFRRSYGYARNHVIVSRSVYGRPVPGSRRTTRLFLRSAIREFALVNSLVVYRELEPEARRHGIDVGLFEFIFIRLVSTKLGQAFGILAGVVAPRVSRSSLADLHAQRGPEVEHFVEPPQAASHRTENPRPAARGSQTK